MEREEEEVMESEGEKGGEERIHVENDYSSHRFHSEGLVLLLSLRERLPNGWIEVGEREHFAERGMIQCTISNATFPPLLTLCPSFSPLLSFLFFLFSRTKVPNQFYEGA